MYCSLSSKQRTVGFSVGDLVAVGDGEIVGGDVDGGEDVGDVVGGGVAVGAIVEEVGAGDIVGLGGGVGGLGVGGGVGAVGRGVGLGVGPVGGRLMLMLPCNNLEASSSSICVASSIWAVAATLSQKSSNESLDNRNFVFSFLFTLLYKPGRSSEFANISI